MTSHEPRFPDRCIKCNAPAGGYRLKRKLYWHPPAWYFLILISILVYAIVVMFIRKTAQLHVGLCDRHRRRRALMMAIGIAVPLIAMGGCAMATDPTTLLLVAILAVLGGLVVLAVASQVVTPARIDERFVRVKGVGTDFLASLPQFSGRFV